MSDPLPTECKDLAFARNLIAQMKGEGGRHNSTVNRARVSASVANGSVESQQMRAPSHGQQERVRLEPDVNAPPPMPDPPSEYFVEANRRLDRAQAAMDLAHTSRERTATEVILAEHLEALRRRASDVFGIPPGYFERARALIESGQLRWPSENFRARHGYGTAEMPHYRYDPLGIGRWGNHFIRSEAQYCEIGDAFRYELGLCPTSDTHFQLHKRGHYPFQNVFETLEFKKVGIRVTPDNGQTWREEYFWERVE